MKSLPLSSAGKYLLKKRCRVSYRSRAARIYLRRGIVVEEHRHRAGWPKWIILAASAASFAPLAGAQTVSGTGDVQPGPVASPDWVVGGD
ncbi:hypothetical protein, partial [Achromobacter ruhlandii]|uniref:hypothetical protein n=1 Tax=Achromobacter ruhlandii TaxID=72557 RepID=UPI0021F0E06A